MLYPMGWEMRLQTSNEGFGFKDQSDELSLTQRLVCGVYVPVQCGDAVCRWDETQQSAFHQKQPPPPGSCHQNWVAQSSATHYKHITHYHPKSSITCNSIGHFSIIRKVSQTEFASTEVTMSFSDIIIIIIIIMDGSSANLPIKKTQCTRCTTVFELFNIYSRIISLLLFFLGQAICILDVTTKMTAFHYLYLSQTTAS